MSQQKPSKSAWSRYGYLWVTLALFGISITGHWVLGWYAFVRASQMRKMRAPKPRLGPGDPV